MEEFLDDWDKDEGYRDKLKANALWIEAFKKSKLIDAEDKLTRTVELLYDDKMWDVIHESKRIQAEAEKDSLIMVPREEWRRITRIVWLLTGLFTLFGGLFAAAFFKLI